MESKKSNEVMNAQMEMLKVTFDELGSIHESCAKIAEFQEKHAKLLVELAGLLGVKVVDTDMEKEEKTPGRIVSI